MIWGRQGQYSADAAPARIRLASLRSGRIYNSRVRRPRLLERVLLRGADLNTDMAKRVLLPHTFRPPKYLSARKLARSIHSIQSPRAGDRDWWVLPYCLSEACHQALAASIGCRHFVRSARDFEAARPRKVAATRGSSQRSSNTSLYCGPGWLFVAGARSGCRGGDLSDGGELFFFESPATIYEALAGLPWASFHFSPGIFSAPTMQDFENSGPYNVGDGWERSAQRFQTAHRGFHFRIGLAEQCIGVGVSRLTSTGDRFCRQGLILIRFFRGCSRG